MSESVPAARMPVTSAAVAGERGHDGARPSAEIWSRAAWATESAPLREAPRLRRRVEWSAASRAASDALEQAGAV